MQIFRNFDPPRGALLRRRTFIATQGNENIPPHREMKSTANLPAGVETTLHRTRRVGIDREKKGLYS
jgi:hypothetical protein